MKVPFILPHTPQIITPQIILCNEEWVKYHDFTQCSTWGWKWEKLGNSWIVRCLDLGNTVKWPDNNAFGIPLPRVAFPWFYDPSSPGDNVPSPTVILSRLPHCVLTSLLMLHASYFFLPSAFTRLSHFLRVLLSGGNFINYFLKIIFLSPK